WLTGRRIRGLPFGAHQKLRARQNSPQRQLDAVLESAATAAFLVETLHPLHILRSHRTAIGPPHERCQDFSRAWLFLRGARWPARVHLADAARILGTRRRERSLNFQKADRRRVL